MWECFWASVKFEMNKMTPAPTTQAPIFTCNVNECILFFFCDYFFMKKNCFIEIQLIVILTFVMPLLSLFALNPQYNETFRIKTLLTFINLFYIRRESGIILFLANSAETYNNLKIVFRFESAA